MPDDDTIGGAIRRDLDRLPLLPPERWLPRGRVPLEPARMRSALGLVRSAGVALALVLIVTAAGVGLAGWRASHVVTPSPVASAGIPGPLALAGGAPSAGFGLVSTQVNTLLIRNETTAVAAVAISDAPQPVAVSPNGHTFAYASSASGAAWQLRVWDTLDPSIHGEVVFTARPGSEFGAFIWSSDGAGLVVNTHPPVRRGADRGQGTADSRWYAVEIANARVTELPAQLGAVAGTAYAWDRARDLITVSGYDGARWTFSTLHAGRVNTFTLSPGATIAAADAYARSVIVSSPTECKTASGGVLPGVSCPILEARDQEHFSVVTTSVVTDPVAGVVSVVFRPRSQDLLVQIPLGNGDARVEIWSDLGRGPHQLLAAYTATPASSGPRELVLPRVDGSAVFLMKFDDTQGGRWFGSIVSLAPATARGDRESTAFEIGTGGNPIASVVLDPSFAFAMASGASPTATGMTSLPSPPGVLSRAEAIANARRLQPSATITRIEGKLVTYGEWERANGAGSGPAADPGQLVWVVALEGTNLYCGMGGLIDLPPCTFAYSVELATLPYGTNTFGSARSGWPAWFDQLEDRDR